MLKHALKFAAIVHATMGQGIVWSNGNTYVGTRVYSTDPRIPPNSKAAIQYLGIPFAAPPVGANRFKAPQLYQEKRENTRINLTESGKPCYNGKDNSQEDCLYLNLFKPDGVPWDEPIPVMVYLYGGGFTDGRADIYNGTEMAIKNNVIVVVPGYRVGMLGCM
jgi:carboxylesterase type B